MSILDYNSSNILKTNLILFIETRIGYLFSWAATLGAIKYAG